MEIQLLRLFLGKKQQIFICICIEMFGGKEANPGPLGNQNGAGMWITPHKEVTSQSFWS